MGLFGRRSPKLPSYVGASLDTLCSDPTWALAAANAGLPLDQCDLAILVGQVTVLGGAVPRQVAPSLLLGLGDTMALAFPDEREVRVLRRPKSHAELQTQRSGTFQIRFGHGGQLDGWMFEEFRDGTPKGEQFGHDVLRFMSSQLVPSQSVTQDIRISSPAAEQPVQAAAAQASGTQVISPDSSSDSHSITVDHSVRRVVRTLISECQQVMDLHNQCFDMADKVLDVRAAAANPSNHPIATRNFLALADRFEREFLELLPPFRAAQNSARQTCASLCFLLGSNDGKLYEALLPMTEIDLLTTDELFHTMMFRMVVDTDFGPTLQTFMEVEQQLAQRLEAMNS